MMPGYAVTADVGREVSAPLWRALRAASAPATVRELHRKSRAHPNAIQLRLKRWSRVGFVDVLPAEEARYAIAPAAAHRREAPTEGSVSADAWAALRRLARPATFEEIVQASGSADRPLYCRLWRWVRSGYVVKTAATPSRFVLSPSAPDVAEPPRVSADARVVVTKPTARARLWATMRILKRFDVPMLLMTAEVTRRSAEDFLNLLARAGYVRIGGHPVTRRGQGNLGFARDWSTYQLLRNTGPRCPVVTNPRDGERMLVDRNTGEAVPIGPGLRRRAREATHGR